MIVYPLANLMKTLPEIENERCEAIGAMTFHRHAEPRSRMIASKPMMMTR
jgi:hypothetical protein